MSIAAFVVLRIVSVGRLPFVMSDDGDDDDNFVQKRTRFLIKLITYVGSGPKGTWYNDNISVRMFPLAFCHTRRHMGWGWSGKEKGETDQVL